MDPLAPDAFDATFSAASVIIPLLIVGGIAFSIVVAVRKAAVLRKAGLSPMTAEAQLLAQAHQSRLLAPERAPGRSAESRLAEAQELHDRGLITADELGEIRQRVLGEV